ncbi:MULTISPECIES: phage major tail protein, TP901-1 family [Bacillus cereus group]|uniref:phage major tail protein, TP901-1 family n=1 Tax=Bacillus cereus group TaxID=86661 RepID=UPI00086402FF|nr:MULTISPECIES: phage major tail protein, TP901-1 family [Bacillus cereus group]AWC29074.1 phage major tail protein, TP901-1 family [Bacillus cytotoxicus]AWC39540.1 phage major tail protein, TP901-1 family [Bacillus cytotoxicus]AWC47471.1 phage major tail protein, TP901-1 family [Bacillus cytotoxicus]AWC53145.1 phage major tail protein, TP901-1 family [Bacillus cytotoxicus]AWC57274.1 phage major tail protein, TP901-1 family [Bacillus cytotoxicus]
MAGTAASPEFKGKETLYLIDIPQPDGKSKTVRLFNQTSGSRSIEAGEIELKTKDKSGSDYGDVTQSVSIEGVSTEGDEALDYIEEAITNKKLVKIHEVSLRSASSSSFKAKSGTFMLSNVELSHENEEFSKYSIEAKLNGTLSVGTISTLPPGASDGEVNVQNTLSAKQ